jgi:hypothetical protein
VVPSVTVTAIAPVTVDGYSGQRIELDWPAARDLSQCRLNEYKPFIAPLPGNPSRGNSPGRHSTLWILDVDGTRFVIDATHLLSASEAQRAEIQAIIDTMVITPPGV